MKNFIKKEIVRSKAENRRTVRQWKHHPIKMALEALSLIASFAASVAVLLLIANAAEALAYGSIGYIRFIGMNKWAGIGADIAYVMLFIVFALIFFILIEAGASAVESRKKRRDKYSEGSSFAEKEIKGEKSDSRAEKSSATALIPILVLAALILVVCVYIWMFNSTVFTNDKIIAKSAFNPSGAEYSYSDIESAEIDNKDGDANLFIDLHMKDGKVVKFDYTGGYESDNGVYYEYPEAFVSNFTKYLRENNIPITYNCTYEEVEQYYFDDACTVYLKDIFEEG